jgi:ABC-type transport system involved in cytochrome bd biosynthesis fused ATPase/permease subunit
MQALIVILLAIIAISVAPWIIGVLALAAGTYVVALAVASALAATLLMALLLWFGVSTLRSKAKERRLIEKYRVDLERTTAELAISAQQARERAEARAREDALEVVRKEQERVKRLVPCPHCSSQIAKGSLYCPDCGKQPISARSV